MSRFVVFVVVVVAVLAVTVKSEDHRCQFTETKVDNCTRPVYVPCSEETSSSSSASSSSEEEHEDDPHSRKRRSIEDFVQNFLRRFFGSDDDDDDETGWCRREETFQCIMYRCYIGCCPGWKWNATARTCSIPEDQTPGITCLNGGSPARGPEGWRCECPSEFTGSQCGEALCKLQCMNNGMCDIVRSRPMCVCPDNFNGTRCETPQCEGGCNGNGKCVVKDGRPMCRCEHEYTGRNCEHLIPDKVKKGQCPPITATTLGTCLESCETDQGCPNKMKCCSNGCGHACMQPANFTCYHGGRNYRIGDVFRPDNCNVCTCLTPDKEKPFGGAQCRKPVCPELTNCQNVQEDSDSCCPYCADEAKPDTEYTEPKFNNCPENMVTIDVQKDQNKGTLPLTLIAIDFRGNKLEVKLTREEFEAGIGEQNFDTVIATTERDEMGKYAYCQFHVRIRDIHAPTFSHCPPDILLSKEGKAEWEEPKASDNVGLVPTKIPLYKSGDHFRKGEHPIVYTAEDYEGNLAKCRFLVKVGNYDEFHMQPDKDYHHGKRHIMYIGIGVAVFFFLIVLLLATYLYRRCRRARRDVPANPPAYENNIYNIGSTLAPPPYKEKPPMYISETEKKVGASQQEKTIYEEIKPPAYVLRPEDIPEKMDEVTEDKVPLDVDDVDVKMGIDNPAIRL